VYSSIKEQRLLNVPIVKPLLIVILDGQKKLGEKNEITCSLGEFVFISDSPETSMRNIPQENQYRSLLIEFEYQDFNQHSTASGKKQQYFTGKVTTQLEQCLMQFIDWTKQTPPAMWARRREEIIELLFHMGYQEVFSMAANATVGQRVHNIVSKQLGSKQFGNQLHIRDLSTELAMSESTLRRKLSTEGTSLQSIKDQVRMGQGLHLLQTTQLPISIIAEKCGYLSQSRFSERFKLRFGLTPSALRKTRFD
jgi:AraC-like DNA-binding protein